MGKQNNRGVTLIELVVAAVILAVVIGVGMSFIVHATNIFNRGNGESNLQNEAQLTMARLQNLIVNSTHGVSTAPPQATPAVPDPGAGGSGVNLYVYNREETDEASGSYNVIRYLITHIYQDGENLMYAVQEYAPQASGSFALMPEGSPKVLSEYITDFQVNLDDFAEKHSVKVTLGFKNQKQEFSTTNTFLLRNAISDKTDGEADDYFKEDATADKKNEITALSISPTDVYVWQGSTLAGPFSVAAQVGSEWKSGASVIWSINAPDGTDATISRATGSVQVGPDVTGNLSVHATARSSLNAGVDESRYVVSNEAIVHVKSFENVNLSNPLPHSADDHKTYEAIFTVLGGNLEKDTDMREAPFVAAGSDLTATFEKQPESSGPAGLRWKVIIRRPAAYQGKTYKLVVGYRLNGQTKTCQVDGITFTPSDAETAQGVAEVRLWDETDGVAYEMTGGIRNIMVARGSARDLQMQVRYGGGTWQIKDSNDWSIRSDNPDVKVMKDGLGYHLSVDVKNYSETVAVSLVTKYTDNQGTEQEGPELMFTCNPVRIRLNGVASSIQKKFPVARGETESLSFVVENLEGAGVGLLSKGDQSSSSTMRVSVNGRNASVRVASGQRSSMTFCFGVRTAGGEMLPDDICCELTLVPGDANVFSDSSGSLTKLFLPKAADLTSYSAQIAVPDEGETAILYTAGGKKVVYRMTGGKYYVEYDGKRYVYDSSWRGWVPAA